VFVPSDFPLANLDQQKLEHIMKKFSETNTTS